MLRVNISLKRQTFAIMQYQNTILPFLLLECTSHSNKLIHRQLNQSDVGTKFKTSFSDDTNISIG